MVSFTLTDAKKQPLDVNLIDANSLRFTIAKISPDGNEYINYIVNTVKGAAYNYHGQTNNSSLIDATQPAMDSGGDLQKIQVGQYNYKFKFALPPAYDKSATHAVGGQVTRNNRRWVGNDVFYFVPSGGNVKTTRQEVATASCNQCHDPLEAHGGSRQDTRLCALCHTPQNTDPETGNTLEFKVLVHKMHDGDNLPSVEAGNPFYFVGFNQSVSDFSNVGFPQDIRNCTTCHGEPPIGMKDADYAKIAPDSSHWKSNPSRAACGSCHDNIDFATGKSRLPGGNDHQGGPQNNDALCVTCHQPSGKEFDATVVGAHTIPANSQQLKGLKWNLISAAAAPGQKPTVEFSIQDNAGNYLDPNNVDRVEITIGYPTSDYAQRVTENVNIIPAANQPPFVRSGTLADLGGGKWRYTFSNPIDPAWIGSVGISIAGYKNTTVVGTDGENTVVREGNINPGIYVPLDAAGKPVARRSVVDIEKCNSCHKDLGSPAGIAIHGGSRRNPQLCVICHNANLTDEARRAPADMPPESLQFKYLIHSLHMDDARAVPSVLNGLSTASILNPGNPADCLKCHYPDTYTLPLPDQVLPETITQGGKVVSVVQPITAACLGCHIGQPGFDAHAATMTSADKAEACTICHGRGASFDVATMHEP
jgi:OmcA/MtrC family decaheme c-type cytochrome